MATKKKKTTKKKLTKKQIKYFGTPAQKAALKRSRSTAAKKTTKKKTTKKTTKKKSNKTLTTGQGVAIGLGSAAVGAAAGAAGATLLNSQIQGLLDNMAASQNTLISKIGSIFGGDNNKANSTPIASGSTQQLPAAVVVSNPIVIQPVDEQEVIPSIPSGTIWYPAGDPNNPANW